MNTERSVGYTQLKEFMQGWKHGASASAKKTEAGLYGEGYAAGQKARHEAGKAAQIRFKVSSRELMQAVLR